MGYKVITENVNNILRQLSKDYLIYAPKEIGRAHV